MWLLDIQLIVSNRLTCLVQQCIGSTDTKGDYGFWALPEYAEHLYNMLVALDWHNPGKDPTRFAANNATWHFCIAVALQNASAELKPLDEKALRAGIISSLTHLKVHEIPGTWHGRLSYRKTTQLRPMQDLWSHQRLEARIPQRIEYLLDRTTLHAQSGVFEGRIADPPRAALCFLFQTPFSQLPKTIVDGCEGLITDYQTRSATSIISTHTRQVLDQLDLEDPITQLALILISVLSIPTPLPWCPRKPEETKFVDHIKVRRAKDRWCAILFLKMMWFRNPKTAEKEFMKCLNDKQGKPCP